MVAHAFPRWQGDVAGSFLGRLAGALVTRGHTVRVVTPADAGRADPYRLGEVEVVPVRYDTPEREDLAFTGDMARKARSPRGALSFVRLVRALARGAASAVSQMDAHVVHAFWWVPGGWAASRVTTPRIISLMGTDVAMMRSLPGGILARRVLRRATRVSAISRFLADQARRRTRLPGLEIAHVPMPVDVERFDTQEPGGGGGVVYLGRLIQQKRVDLLLRALRHARIAAPVTIIGDGPAREELETLARTLELSTVRFCGALPDGEVPPLVSRADVAAFLSRAEGLGLAAAEALMLGVPVIATTDGGGVLDLVQDGDGACVVAPTPEAVGGALQHCLTDPAMRVAAGAAGRRLRSRLAPGAVAAEFETLYRSVI